jgi:hypothetical protein
MKRSRLNLFKVTSMSISVLGILMIIITIGVIAYLGITSVTGSISKDVGSGSSYDQLNALTKNYDELQTQYSGISSSVHNSHNATLKTAYANAQLQLENTNTTINNVNSALTSGLPHDEVQDRIKAAQAQLVIARDSLNNVTSLM